MQRRETSIAFGQHVRHAYRRLRGAPGFAAAVLVMLALGIGATTAVFGVVDGILLRPLPFSHPERLVQLSHSIRVPGIDHVEQSDASVLLYQRHATSAFEQIAGWQTREVNLAAGHGNATAERLLASAVTANLFSTLGVVPMLGRAFRPDDGRPGAPRVVVISAQLWRRVFGGDASVVGRRIVIDGVEREIVGVLPDAVLYPSSKIALWAPLAIDPLKANPGGFNYTAVARLRPGVSNETARSELARVLPLLMDEFPSKIPKDMWEQAHLSPIVQPLRDAVVGDVGRMLWVLFGAVALLLAVSCANVASLFLVRAEGAQRDVAIRIALGAGRRVIVAQYLAEALLLAAGGGALGVGLASYGVKALRAAPAGADLPRLAEVTVDARVMTFAVLLMTLSAGAISLLAVLRAGRVAPGVVLKESSRSATVGRDRQRARSVLVVAQVALALVLVAGSALMARSFARLRDVRPGFDAQGVFTMRVAVSRAAYPDAAAVARFHQRVLADAAGIPGVRSAALTSWLPLSTDHDDSVLMIEDHPLPAGAVPPDHTLGYVTPEYFRTMGIPLLTGRVFEGTDSDHPSTDALVSASFAARYWKGENAIGKRIRPSLDGEWYTIVGIVGDVHMTSLDKPAEEFVYFPLVTPGVSITADKPVVSAPRGVTYVVRTAGDPGTVANAMRAVVRRIDPDLPTYEEQPMSGVVSAATARTRFVLVMLGAASAIALVIGAVGLYGVLAYGVTLRRREIGVRVALGASVRDITGMVAGRGIRLAALGVAMGLAGALAATRVMHGLLFEVSPTDPLTLGAACVVLLAVAVVASWLPARRAAVMDPTEALRRD